MARRVAVQGRRSRKRERPDSAASLPNGRGSDGATSVSDQTEPAAEIVTLALTGLAPTGEAIGRHEGMVVFVPFGLPGESVRVRLVERKRSFGRGEIVERLDSAPERVQPACPYFGRCGGCDWQHMAYGAQLRAKTALVVEQLARIGKLPDAPVRPCVPSPSAYEYRNHARLHVTAEGRIGYRAARSHVVVPVADCPICEPPLRAALADLAGRRVKQAPGGEIELAAWEDQITVGPFAYRAGEGAFFQANTAVAGLLVAAVLDALALRGGEHVLDLYCGVGLFTVPIAQRGAQVTGVEANAEAAADAESNLRTAGAAGQILAGDVGEALRSPHIGGQPWDAVLLDPPRTGVDAPALAALAALAAPRLVYVSCEAATLARDLRVLADGGYTLQWAQPFDMFPQTRHVETLALLATNGQS